MLKKQIRTYSNLNNTRKFYRENPLFSALLLLTILILIFFRLYNYLDRLVVLADNSRDAQIALYAAKNLQIPQIGPFSQAPFFFGPWWYWFLTGVYILVPFTVLAPWLFMSFLSFIFAALVFWVGREIGGKWLGLLAFFFAAISPQAISNYFAIWNPAIIPLLVLISIVFSIKFLKSYKPIDIFIVGFIIGLATTIHFQSFLIFPTGILAILFIKKSKIKNLALYFLAFLIPFVPFLIFDLNNYWFWSKSVFIYLAIDQYSIYVPNRWLTYATQYWPEVWSSILGGSKYVAILTIFCIGFFALKNLREFNKHKLFFLVAIAFAIQVLLFRYYRGERLIYYSYFAHPFILILSSWVCYQVFEFKKLLGVVFVLLVGTFTLNQTLATIKGTSITLKKVNAAKLEIYKKFPNSKFEIYGCTKLHSSYSKPLALLTYFDDRNSLGGIKVGICETENSYIWQTLPEIDVDLNIDWTNDNTQYIYENNIEWYKNNPPPKDQAFWYFLMQKLNPKCYPRCD